MFRFRSLSVNKARNLKQGAGVSAKWRPAMAIAGAVALGLAPTTGQAGTERLGGVYDISVAGFRIARGSLSLVVQGNAYSAKVGMEPAGIGTLFSTGKGGAEASGWLRGSTVQPARYTMASRASNRDFYVDLALGAGNIKSMDVSPQFKPNKERIKITDQHRRKVVDPLSAILMPVTAAKGSSDAAACNRKIPVFDGWTRFDIHLAYKETRQVSGHGYDGPVVVCSAQWIPVAGHRPSRAKASYMTDNKSMEAWLAPLKAGRVFVPYRIQMSTRTGLLVVEANTLKLSGSENDQAAR